MVDSALYVMLFGFALEFIMVTCTEISIESFIRNGLDRTYQNARYPRAGGPWPCQAEQAGLAGLVVTGSFSGHWVLSLTSPLCPVMGCSYDAAASDGEGCSGHRSQ